jgi:penicillin-binding protein-related factor A (putative recombinase)
MEFIKHILKNNLNIDYYKILQYEQEDKAIKFDHSELINYFGRHFPKNIISINQIKDDVEKIKLDLHKNVSLMSFICQAFIWHYEKTHT